MESDKKRAERWFVERLKTQISDFPPGEIVDHEKPDFLVASHQGTIGVEVARIYQRGTTNGQQPQAKESERRIILEMAQRLYEQEANPIVEVSISFSDSTSLKSADRERCSRELYTLVKSNLPPPNEWSEVDFQSASGQIFLGEFDRVRIARFDVLDQNLWSVPEVGFVQEDFIEELQYAIHAKNAKYQRYLATCEQCWLLVVSDASGPSTFFSASSATLGHVYHSRFERTYFIETFTRNVYRLKTTPETTKLTT